ncbi:hypothetical protein RSAG8_02778, partial [Rhizoctonia solani AG-8 WAC10335]
MMRLSPIGLLLRNFSTMSCRVTRWGSCRPGDLRVDHVGRALPRHEECPGLPLECLAGVSVEPLLPSVISSFKL